MPWPMTERDSSAATLCISAMSEPHSIAGLTEAMPNTCESSAAASSMRSVRTYIRPCSQFTSASILFLARAASMLSMRIVSKCLRTPGDFSPTSAYRTRMMFTARPCPQR